MEYNATYSVTVYIENTKSVLTFCPYMHTTAKTWEEWGEEEQNRRIIEYIESFAFGVKGVPKNVNYEIKKRN